MPLSSPFSPLLLLLLLLFSPLSSSSTCNDVISLWPAPTRVTCGTETLSISPSSFTITSHPNNAPSGILARALERYRALVFSAALRRDPPEDSGFAAGLAFTNLQVRVLDSSEDLSYGIDDSYNLTISSTSGYLLATTVFGAIYGLETFSQLIVSYRGTDSSALIGAPWVIEDKPRFKWRGLMVDTARHFYPVDFILHTIEAMAANKMNVFHWHVLDADSFPLVSQTYPDLSAQGAYAHDAIYSPESVQHIIQFAKDRGVRVMVEFDIPGHSSFGYAYPEIVGCPSYYDHPYVYQKQSVALDPTVDLTYEIVGNFIREFAGVFPDAYMHLGGDEVRHHCWETKPSILAFMEANGIPTYLDLERYFWKRLTEEVLADLPKRVMVWDETFVNEVPVPEDSLIHVWQQDSYMTDVIKGGKQVVRSNGWYLDQAVPGDTRYRWLETWIDFYMLEPIPAGLTPDEEALVLGGQPCMWTEQVDHNTFDTIVWPRASAAAERLWSDRNLRNSTEAGYRLMDHRCRLHMRNINASPIFPDFCERDIGVSKSEQRQPEHRQPGLRQPQFPNKMLKVGQQALPESPAFTIPGFFPLMAAFLCGAAVMVTAFFIVKASQKLRK